MRLPDELEIRRTDDLPVLVCDADGHPWMRAGWRGRRLDLLRVQVADQWLELRPHAGSHPLLGSCDAIVWQGQTIALIRSVDWAEPAHIPPIDRPGALPPGAGAAILNFLAICTGERPLRYLGPYPTEALFESLLTCFAIDGDPHDARARFTEEALAATMAGTDVSPPVWFRPAPFARVVSAKGRAIAQRRAGLDCVTIDGLRFEPDAVRALQPEQDRWVCALVFGDQRLFVVAQLDAEGRLVDGPHRPPPLQSPLCNQPLPESVCAALKQLLVHHAPGPLRSSVLRLLQTGSMAWGDPGLAAATWRGRTLQFHARLPEFLPPDLLLRELARAAYPLLVREATRLLENLLHTVPATSA